MRGSRHAPPTGIVAAPARRHRRRTTVGRVFGVAVLVGIAYGIYYLIFQSGALDPILAYATPLKQFIGWVAEEPTRLLTAGAIILIPHIGLYYYFFEDR